MRTTSIRPDDIVRCDVRGTRFFARVVPSPQDDFGRGGIWIEALNGQRQIPTHRVSARQIIEHYSKRKG